MRIEVGQFEYTECWDGVLYKKLSDYPNITEWEIQNILDFVKYESGNGRSSYIEADSAILQAIDNYRKRYENGDRLPPPTKITECTACPMYKGCMTDLVCHASSLKDAISILNCGRLLSAVLARKKSAKDLKAESRNAANDPEDYFDYVMFAWENCQAGDRLVEDIITHPKAVFDGVLPVKVKNEVVLQDWAHLIVVPSKYRTEIEPYIPDALSEKVHFVARDGSDIWKWAEIAYEYAKSK